MRLALNFPRIDPARGGAETYLVDLCQGLIRAGHQVDLYAERWVSGCLPPEVRCVAVPAAGNTRLQRLWAFARNSEAALAGGAYDCTVGFINTYAHDVIIPQGGVLRGSLAANAQRFAHPIARRLYVLGKTLNPSYWTYRAIERRQYAASREARVIAVSHLVRRHLQDIHQVPRSRIHVVPNAIDPERLRVAQPGAVRCRFRNRLGLEPSDLVGLFVGHNFALKGLEPLLRGLARHRRAGGRSIHLLVCGGGRAGAYRRLAARLGLGESVRFLGHYPDVRDCYWSSDFFASPTYYDPCSLVVLEALACGLPVITTACNGASELMTDGRQGRILSHPTDSPGLLAALGEMADDRRRRAMAAEALKLGRAHTFENHLAALVRVFEEVAEAKRRKAHAGKTGGGPHGRARRNRKNAPR